MLHVFLILLANQHPLVTAQMCAIVRRILSLVANKDFPHPAMLQCHVNIHFVQLRKIPVSVCG